MDIKTERPSIRSGSIPFNSPNKGKYIMEKWDWMVKNYDTLMGWNPDNGEPLPDTLKKLRLWNLYKGTKKQSLDYQHYYLST